MRSAARKRLVAGAMSGGHCSSIRISTRRFIGIQGVGNARVRLAHADRAHLCLRDAPVEEKLGHRLRPPLGKAEIVLLGAAGVGIALDDETGARQLVVVERLGELVEILLRLRR